MNFTITATNRSKPNNAPKEPLEFDLDRRLDAIMPPTIRGPTDNNVTAQMNVHDRCSKPSGGRPDPARCRWGPAQTRAAWSLSR